MLTRHHIIAYLDEIDARRSRVAAEPRICACCGEEGAEWDDFAVVHTAHHHAAMRRHYGGACCIPCLDSDASCDRCGHIGDHANPVRSQVFGDERLCAYCEEYS